MAFQVSPGVQVKEIDLTNVVPAVSSTVGGFAGAFRWGPVDEVVSVSDSQGLVDNFYTPADTNAGAEDFYSAEAFLRYGSSLKVVRVASADAYNANNVGFVPDVTGVVPCYERNKNLIITVKSKHPSPATIVSYQWEGKYTNRNYTRV